MTEEGTVLLKTASVKNLSFPYHLLSPSQRPLSLLYFDPSLSNIQTSMYIFHLKTQNLPQLHSCPTTALTLSFSFKTTFLKKFKFLCLLIYSPIHSNLAPIPIMPSRGFTRVTKVPEPRSGTHISVFTLRGSLWADQSFSLEDTLGVYGITLSWSTSSSTIFFTLSFLLFTLLSTESGKTKFKF